MFSFFRKPQAHHTTTAIARAMASDGLPPGMDAAQLEVVEQRGSYSGRKVTYFRVFDPKRVAERPFEVRTFADLDAHPELLLGSGHVEQNGAVVLTRRAGTPSTASATAGSRSEADRTKHGDDERLVFPDAAS